MGSSDGKGSHPSNDFLGFQGANRGNNGSLGILVVSEVSSPFKYSVIGKMLVPLGWYPSYLTPPRSPLKGDLPNKYPLYKVYTGLIIKGTIPRVPAFSP